MSKTIDRVLLYKHERIQDRTDGHELEQLTGYCFDIHEDIRLYVDKTMKNYHLATSANCVSIGMAVISSRNRLPEAAAATAS